MPETDDIVETFGKPWFWERKKKDRVCSNCYFSHAYVLKREPVYRMNASTQSLDQIQPALKEDRLKCRRYAPGKAFWPEVGATDWCGEFEEKRHD